MTDFRLKAPPLVLSAPSGSGKTTIARALVERERDFVFSVSVTTRTPRRSEKNGRDYWFVSEAEFRKMVARGELAEWAEVHGELYGTPRDGLVRAAEAGRYVILDIDVQGARQIRQTVPEARLLFILPPSVEELFRRLKGRGTEREGAIRRRLATALEELKAVEAFDFFVTNDDLERSISEVRILARTGRPPPGGCSGTLEGARKLREDVEALLRQERLT
jgi:guanylate kinase